MDIEFDDGKEPGAMRTIGEVSAALGIKPHVLRYWEQQFPSLKPLKRSGSRRYYRANDVALIQRIDQLVNREGYTIKGAKKALAKWHPDSDTAAPTVAQSDVASPGIEASGDDQHGKEASVFFTEEGKTAKRDGDGNKSNEDDLIDELKSIRQSLKNAID